MLDLFIYLAIGYRLYSFFRLFGILIGIGLIVIWWRKVKSTVALFHNKDKIAATKYFFVPGAIMVLLGLYFRFFWYPSLDSTFGYDGSFEPLDQTPVLASLYISNYSDDMGYVKVGSRVDSLEPKHSIEMYLKSDLEVDTLRLYLGDSLVLDTLIERGAYIGNFSDDIFVIAEELIYSSRAAINTDNLQYLILSAAGIEQFSSSLYPDLYGFSRVAPDHISVPADAISLRKWDIEAIDPETLIESFSDSLSNREEEEGTSIEILEGED